ncbi:Non-specific serine/threonine protein kinase [Bertholletia excelsa]
MASSQLINRPGEYRTESSHLWTIDPFVLTSDRNFQVTPILVRGKNVGDPVFVCGFFCNNSNGACIFAILLFADQLELDRVNAPQVVWSANGNYPVERGAKLLLNKGSLTLLDAALTLVWSANAVNYSAWGLNLTEDGNLVLFDQSNRTIWQSFEYPTDSLLPGQELSVGQKLTASASASDWSSGLFSFAADEDGFFAYTESSPNQFYFSASVYNWNWGELKPGQFVRLEPDGHLKTHYWGGFGWEVLDDLLGIDDCGYPTVCGRFGICSLGQCACPEIDPSVKKINFRKANNGCTLVAPESCGRSWSQYHLLELQNTSYFILNTDMSKTLFNKRVELEGCKTECLIDCSCKAAVFHSEGCLLLSDVFSFTRGNSLYNTSVFLKVQKSPKKKVRWRHLTITIGYSLGSFLFGVVSVTALCFFLQKKRKESKEHDDVSLEQVPGMPTRFSYQDLKTMTDNFSIKVGGGGFGSVFEGTLNNGNKVAVKHLDGEGQIIKSFLAEVETIGSIHHVNLVRLIGFCAEKTYKLLVYEYMPNGSLDKWIFFRHQMITLRWHCRRNIIINIAKGLAYLHEECRQKILHLDIKPQNILLDENFNAKLADFGLAKLIDKDKSHTMTTLRGTPGYLAPEWMSSIITEKVDVYSFGIVVLEILCGRRNLDRSRPAEDMHLLNLFERKIEENELSDMVDRYSEDMQLHAAEVMEMMKLAAWCLQNDHTQRPTMSMVVKVLEGSLDVEINLNYSFTKPAAPRTIVVNKETGVVAATTLIPSILSGPR